MSLRLNDFWEFSMRLSRQLVTGQKWSNLSLLNDVKQALRLEIRIQTKQQQEE